MEEKRDFLNEIVTTNNDVTQNEEEVINVFSAEDATISERKNDYVVKTDYDEEQENNIEKEQVNSIISECNCELNELLDILAVIYYKYSEYKGYLNIRNISPETIENFSMEGISDKENQNIVCRYRFEIEKSTADSSKIAKIVEELLKLYNPINIVSVLKTIPYYELADLIYDQDLDTFYRYFDEQNIESKSLYIRLSKNYNTYNADSEYDD